MRKTSGFSLLELVLALGLTVIILSAITGAIRLYLFQLQRQSDDVERRQVARGVLRMISEDVRSAIQFKPEDYSGLEDLIESQNLSGIGDVPVGQEGGGDVDADALENEIINAATGGGGGEESESTDEPVEEEEVELGRPTLVGNQSFLRIDISRLPRLDEYNPLIIRNQSEIRLPADVKSVTYFFSESTPSIQNELDPGFGENGGLYRREIDRAVEAFRNGDNDIEIVIQPDDYCELVSPEISGVEFRYWDGENWLNEWDSSEMMGFPSAIELAVVIDPERFAADVSIDNLQNLDVEVSRTVIHLPVAEIIEDDEESDEEAGQ